MKQLALTLALALLAAPAFAADLGEVVPQAIAAETAAAPSSEAPETTAPEVSTAEEVALPETLDLEGMDTENKIISWNPCYNFDNKPQGCYRTWSPQTLCCIGRGYGCHDICY